MLAGTSFGLSHTYPTLGLYTVTVCVTDGGGLTGCDSLVVTVAVIRFVFDFTSGGLIYYGGLLLAAVQLLKLIPLPPPAVRLGLALGFRWALG